MDSLRNFNDPKSAFYGCVIILLLNKFFRFLQNFHIWLLTDGAGCGKVALALED